MKWYTVENYNKKWDYNKQREKIPLPRYGEDIIIKNEGSVFIGYITKSKYDGTPIVVDLSSGYQHTLFDNGLQWGYCNDELEYLTLYMVTKGNTDGCIKAGDIIWISLDGWLNDATTKGMLCEEEWKDCDTIKDFEVQECTSHVLEIGDGYERVKVK